MKVSCKVWLDQDGKAFGEGPYHLLRTVEKTASLNEAAHQMGMSYSKAWSLIRTLEERLGFPLLERKVGGQSGGGSKVTPEAKHFMNRYEEFSREVKTAVQEIYERHFRDV